MISGQDQVVHTKDQIREIDVAPGMRRHLLHMMAQAIAEIAGEAGAERRQSIHGFHGIALRQIIGGGEGIAPEVGAIQAHVPALRLQPRERVDTEE